MEKYSKAVAAVVATVLAAVVAALTGDNAIDATEWVNVAILAVGACSVFAAPNVPGAAFTKSVLAALSAGLVVLASVIIGGLDTVELLQIGLAVLGALGVYAVPNKVEGRNVLGVVR
jgi:hypothetical protein